MLRFGHQGVVMAFGKKTAAAPPPESIPSPPAIELSATERLRALGEEREAIAAALAQQGLERERLMRDGGSLEQVEALDAADRRARLRLEQIDALAVPLQGQIAEERRAAWEAAWQARRPALAEAETELVAAIGALYPALDHAHNTYNAAIAAGFAERLKAEFLQPPPKLLSDYALREYRKAVERRAAPWSDHAAAPVIELPTMDDSRAPSWKSRFRPRKVPRDLVEQISPLEERRVRVLHTFNASNLNFGHIRLLAGTEMMVPAPAAFAMTYAGVAEYIDEPATAVA